MVICMDILQVIGLFKHLFLFSGVFCFFVAFILAFYTRTMYDTGLETEIDNNTKPPKASFLASYLAIGLGLLLIAVGLLGFFV